MINIDINKLKTNPNNPRIIKDDKFNKLVKSIKDFPEMLSIRPIVVNKDMFVLGGNMRLKACKEAGLKEVSIIIADNLTPEQQSEFIIKDNVGFGEWDWEQLANQWDHDLLNEWGLNAPIFNTDFDYSVLEGDLSEELASMSGLVKKAIQIEFESDHYEEAAELVKFWRNKDLYIGGFLLEKLKEEKNKA